MPQQTFLSMLIIIGSEFDYSSHCYTSSLIWWIHSMYHANKRQFLVFRCKEKKDKRNFWFTLLLMISRISGVSFATISEMWLFSLRPNSYSENWNIYLPDHSSSGTFHFENEHYAWKHPFMSNILICYGVFYFFVHKQCFMKTYFFGNSFCSLYIHLLGLSWGTFHQHYLLYKIKEFPKTPKLLSLSFFFFSFKYEKCYDVKYWTKVKILIIE